VWSSCLRLSKFAFSHFSFFVISALSYRFFSKHIKFTFPILSLNNSTLQGNFCRLNLLREINYEYMNWQLQLNMAAQTSERIIDMILVYIWNNCNFFTNCSLILFCCGIPIILWNYRDRKARETMNPLPFSYSKFDWLRLSPVLKPAVKYIMYV
jgi:hypothetical protein